MGPSKMGDTGAGWFARRWGGCYNADVRLVKLCTVTNAPPSVSPLTWSHATLVMSVCEYAARRQEIGG